MTVLAVDRPRRDRAAAAPAAPFLVQGTVHGRAVEAAAHGIDDVLDRIGDWTAADADATGSWRLNPDYSEPIVLVVRRVGAGTRPAHLVRLLPATRYGGSLRALCGDTLRITAAESLAVGDGMPCEDCLLAIAPAGPRALAPAHSPG